MEQYKRQLQLASWLLVAVLALGSLWLLPCVLLQWLFELQRWQIIEMLFAVALFLWPLSIYLDRVNPLLRQSLPDRFGGTRLVELPKNLVKLS